MFYSDWLDSYVTFCTKRIYNNGIQMVKKKNKKKKIIRPLNSRLFPGYDLYVTLAIMFLVVVLAACAGCYLLDTVYRR